MIRSYKGKFAEKIARQERPKGFPSDLIRSALNKLVLLDDAAALSDLMAPPGNRLEALKGNRADRHSIRINDQWRICFRWTPAGPEDVELVDDH